jgi:hypothetical protein
MHLGGRRVPAAHDHDNIMASATAHRDSKISDWSSQQSGQLDSPEH